MPHCCGETTRVIDVLNHLANNHEVERLEVELADSVGIRAINCYDVESLVLRCPYGTGVDVEANQFSRNAGEASVEPTPTCCARSFAARIRKPDMYHPHPSRTVNEPGIT